MNYTEIYEKSMPPSKRNEEKFNLWVAWVVRPLSIIGTIPFLRSNIKPITITFISILCSIIGFVFLAFGQTLTYRLIGWFLFFLWAILDGVDGNLARCTNKTSNLGGLWDATGGYTAIVLIYFSAGIAAFFDLNMFKLAENYIWIILGGLTSVFTIFPRLIMHKKASYQTEALKIANKNKFGLKQIVAMNFVSGSGFLQVILLIAILSHTLNLFILIYFILNSIIMILSLYKLLKE